MLQYPQIISFLENALLFSLLVFALIVFSQVFLFVVFHLLVFRSKAFPVKELIDGIRFNCKILFCFVVVFASAGAAYLGVVLALIAGHALTIAGTISTIEWIIFRIAGGIAGVGAYFYVLGRLSKWMKKDPANIETERFIQDLKAQTAELNALAEHRTDDEKDKTK